MSDDKDLQALDVRNRTKEQAVMALFRAEITYLLSRGWQMLCGTRDNRYYVAPGEDYKNKDIKLYTHDEACKIQKEKDGWYDV
jgi:hypothetical protein